MSVLHIFAACVQLLSTNLGASGDLLRVEERNIANEDFRAQWMHSLLQTVLENRLAFPILHREDGTPFLENGNYQISSDRTIEKSSFELLSDEIENLYCYGAKKSEFDVAKMHLQSRLLDKHEDVSPVFWNQLDAISFQDFSSFVAKELESSEEIDETDDAYFQKKLTPMSLQQKFAKHLSHSARPIYFIHNNELVQGSPEAESLALFESLPINDQERKIIDYIITTMAEKNILKLGLMRKTMEKKGKRIHHVHPFRFLNFVFSYEHLKHSMHKIHKSGFKWDGFIDGFSKKMKEEARHNNLMKYVPGFARSLNVSEESVRQYVAKHDYEGLVRYLMHAT